MFSVHDLNSNGHVIGWDGDVVRPTVDGPLRFDGCVFDLRAGRMTFHTSSRHHLAGQIVLLPPYKERS